MVKFIRQFDREMIEKLKSEQLYHEKLLKDIKRTSNAVFPAIRDNSMTFYYAGGGILNYDAKGFNCHYKYCLWPDPIPQNGNSYWREADIPAIKLQTAFYDMYEEIKERCSKYGGMEAESISKLYGCSPVNSDRYSILDTEIDLCGGDGSATERKNRRIDLLLYDGETGTLRFCEAKHFLNPELWAKAGQKPKVCKQITNYEKLVKKSEAQILEQYAVYVDAMNELFGLNIIKPKQVMPSVCLLIFGFDSYQKIKITSLLKEDGSLEGIPYYATGRIESKTCIKQIFKAKV